MSEFVKCDKCQERIATLLNVDSGRYYCDECEAELARQGLYMRTHRLKTKVSES